MTATPSAAAKAWDGTSTTTTCSTAPSGCSSPATSANLVAAWIPALDGVDAKLRGGRHASPTSVAVTARRRSCSPRPTRRRRSPASTTTRPRSRSPASAPPRPASPTASASRSPRRRTSRATATTWCASSTRCTTWATRSARLATSAGRSPTDGTWLLVEPMAGENARGQRQPRRPDLLRGVDVHLHARGAGAAGRRLPRRPSRPGPVCGAVMEAAGFTRFRQVVDSPTNLVLEVRP